MRKKEKLIAILAITVACIIFVVICNFVIPNIENRDWVLAYAQKSDPYMVVAHGVDYDFSNINDPMYSVSKPVELTLEASGGELIFTDKTNGKTYEGTYRKSLGGFGTRRGVSNRNYTVVIDGIEGTAYFSSTRTLLVSIDGYYLTFEID